MTEHTTDPMAAVRQTLAEMRARFEANTHGDDPSYYAGTALADVGWLLNVLDGVVELAEEFAEMRPFESRTAGPVFLGETVEEAFDRLRAVLAEIAEKGQDRA